VSWLALLWLATSLMPSLVLVLAPAPASNGTADVTTMSGDVTMATIMSPSTALDNPTAGNTSMPVAPALASVLDATIITMVTADTASVTSDPPQSMEPHMQDPPDSGYEDQEMEDVAPLPVQSDGAMKCKRATDAGDAPLDAGECLLVFLCSTILNF
jgi:hypothetical protein